MTMTQLPISQNAGEIPATPIKRPGRPVGSKNKQNAVRDAERAHARNIKEQRRVRHAAQEAKRAQPIQPDQLVVLIVSLVLAAIAMIASGIISFNGITSVAQFVGLAADWQAWMFFGFVELLIVLFTVLYLVLGSRTDDEGNPVSANIEFVGMVFFSAIAVYGNLIHTLNFHSYDFASVETWTGVLLSVSAPIAVIWVTKSASRVLFAKPVRL